MRTARFGAALAVLVAVFAAPGVAHAASITQSFHADSGDACRYGVADGALAWRFGTASPLPLVGVDVNGKLTDRPVPPDSSTACRDDGYYSTVTFVAYAGSAAVDRQTRSANNSIVSYSFALGGSATTTPVSRVTIQVCRSPLVTLPPSYCGATVTYLAPPIA